jgi:FkbM family methyltransferase
VYWDRYAQFPRHRLIKAAVYDRDQTLEFYLDREDGDGSTLFKEKLTAKNGGYGSLDKEHPIRVKPIDLSEWVLQNTSPSDYLILKLDVEGAEYDILEKMFRDGSIERLAHLFVEWHWNRVGVPNERHASVIETLRRLHIHVADWDAQSYRTTGFAS